MGRGHWAPGILAEEIGSLGLHSQSRCYATSGAFQRNLSFVDTGQLINYVNYVVLL